jgi:uncharacterized protein
MREAERVCPLPALTPISSPFWTSGADGVLRFQHCQSCGYYTHPPGPVCAFCLSKEVQFDAVSGKGVVYSHTVNHYPWLFGWDVPYSVALVQLDDQSDLRLFTNIVGCAPESIAIGDRVRVVFERCEDIWLPLFELEKD